MDAHTEEELRMLRARAYGPAADIAHDPPALRRLQQLEALRGGSARGITETLAPSDDPRPHERDDEVRPAADALVEHDPDLDPDVFRSLDDAAPVSAEPGLRRARTAPRTRRLVGQRRRMQWVLSVVAAAALATAVTYALVRISPVSTSSGAPQIAAIDATSTVEVPTGWFGAGPSSGVFDFAGLVIIQSTGAYGGGAGSSASGDCLTVVRADQVPEKEDFDPNSWGFDGEMYSGCGIGTFPATVEVPIDSNSPEELTTRYPSGTALQFVLNGDTVGVFLDSE